MIVERLENGITVILKPRKDVSSASIQFWLKTGALWECEKNRGIAHFLEHMVFNGTEKYTAGEIEKIVENNGGEINAATSYDYTYYYITIPCRHVPVAIKLLEELVFHPLLLPEMVEKEKPIVLEEIARSENDPRQVFWRKFYKKAFRNLNYRYPILGFKETVSAFTAEDVRNFHKTHYNASNLTVVISGNIDEKTLFSFIKDELLDVPSGKENEPPRLKEPPLEPDEEIVRHPAVANAHVIVGWKLPGIREKSGQVALSVLESYLSYGKSSLFFQELVEKRIAYAAAGVKELFLSSGLFYIYGITEPQRVNVLKDRVFKIINDLSDSLDIRAFELAKKKLLKTEIFKRESVESEAEELGYFATLKGNPDYYREFLDSVRRLTPERFVEETGFLKENCLRMTLLPEGGNR
ncbi:M16 family metallopeptidase [Desulfurobacterium sp.]